MPRQNAVVVEAAWFDGCCNGGVVGVVVKVVVVWLIQNNDR